MTQPTRRDDPEMVTVTFLEIEQSLMTDKFTRLVNDSTYHAQVLAIKPDKKIKNRAGVRGNSCFGAAAGHAEHAWRQQPSRTHRLPQLDRGASPLKKKEGKQQK